MRYGSTTGTRLPILIISTWGIPGWFLKKFQLVVVEHEGIAAGKKNVADFLVFADILDCRLELVKTRNGIAVSHFALAGAVPAIHGTDIAHMEKDPIGYRWVKYGAENPCPRKADRSCRIVP